MSPCWRLLSHRQWIGSIEEILLNGSKNHFHTHTSDQILFATHGVGIVANKQEEIQMQEGDTAFIPAGEVHWHGAADGNDFFHISLTRPASQTDMVK